MSTQIYAEATAARPIGSAESPSDESRQFAASLKAWRLSRGLTQDELADKSGVSKASISMAERAFSKHPPKDVTQTKLATALDLTLDELRQMPSGFESLDRMVTTQGTARGGHPIPPDRLNTRELPSLIFPSKWILGATDHPGDLSYYAVSDAAMQPTIKVGDIAVLEPHTDPAPGLFLVGHRQGGNIEPIGIRRVTPTPTGKTRMSCDNERFDRTSAAGEIAILAKVLFIVRAIEPE